MGYYFTYLSKGEQLYTSAETASIAVLPNAAAACAVIIFTMKLGFFLSQRYGGYGYIITVIGAVISAALIVPRIMSVNGTELALTSRKIIGSTGPWEADEAELPLETVTAVAVHQGFFGKLLHYGDIIISSDSQNYAFRYIKAPQAFADRLKSLLDDKAV